jgi:predicted transcriptional regulator
VILPGKTIDFSLRVLVARGFEEFARGRVVPLEAVNRAAAIVDRRVQEVAPAALRAYLAACRAGNHVAADRDIESVMRTVGYEAAREAVSS